MNKKLIAGIRYDNVTLREAVDGALAFITSPKSGHMVVTPNAEIAQRAMEEPALMQVIREADMVLPDGVGVVLASKILGSPLKQKVAGIDFAAALMAELAQKGDGLFLLGGKPGVGEAAAAKLAESLPGLRICGIQDGYFKDDGPVVEAINKSGAEVLFVCLGAPKQEFWMQKNRDRLHVSLMAGLGGSLDGFAGTVRRAPDIWIRLNLEWLYRILKEPKRIGRAMKLPKYVLSVLLIRLGLKKVPQE